MFGRLFNLPEPSLRRRIKELVSWFNLEEHLDKRVSELSQGLKNKANLCKCLLHNPDVIILDEPTASMDVPTAIRVRDLIRDIASQGTSVLLTTHNMAEAKALGSHIAFLDRGRILLEGPREKILQVCSRFSSKITVKCGSLDLVRESLQKECAFVTRKDDVLEVAAEEGRVDEILRKILSVTKIHEVSSGGTELEELFYMFQDQRSSTRQ
jgi:ABC-2 type transport system ATP-binding protein